MIHKIQMEQVACDNCGEDYEESGTGFSSFWDDAASRARDDGWHCDEDMHLCPQCHEVDDNDILVINVVPPIYQAMTDFPGNKDFTMGKLIHLELWNNSEWAKIYIDCQGERTYALQFFEKYPRIFHRINPKSHSPLL